jgi:hypothetical protein
MSKQIPLLINIALLVLLFLSIFILTGCSEPVAPVQPIQTVTVYVTPEPPPDNPRLNAQEVISLAQKHAINNPSDNREKLMGAIFQVVIINHPGTKFDNWEAIYLGNSKWSANYKDGGRTGSWSVFEYDFSVIYLGL